MKTYIRRFISPLAISFASAAVISSSISATGQNKTDILLDSTVNDHKVVFVGEGANPSQDSVRNMLEKFYVDQFRHFQDPLAPYFLFMSKDSNLAMGMGGCVRMRGYFDWGGAIPSPAFAPYLIPMRENPLRERYLGTTPAGTALFFRVIGVNKRFGDYQLYIEANFNGYASRDFLLKKAYATINDWTIGYASSTFSDPASLPPVIDAAGPNAKMSATAVLVRWLHNLKKGWSVAASLETPSDQIQRIDGETAKVEQYVPDVAAFLQYSWGRSSHVRLSGILRTLPYRDLLEGKNHHPVGWGLQVSSILHPTNSLTLYGTFNGGKGYASLGGDLLMGEYDLVEDDARPGRLYAPYSFGGYGGVQYNFTPMIFASCTVGGTRYCPDHSAPSSEYKQGLFMCANVFWYLTPRISCGAEFDLGRRLNVGGESRWARRIGAMAQFSF